VIAAVVAASVVLLAIVAAFTALVVALLAAKDRATEARVANVAATHDAAGLRAQLKERTDAYTMLQQAHEVLAVELAEARARAVAALSDRELRAALDGVPVPAAGGPDRPGRDAPTAPLGMPAARPTGAAGPHK